MCIKEGLRLYPTIPFLARETTKDFEVGGVTVPAKTMIAVNPFLKSILFIQKHVNNKSIY